MVDYLQEALSSSRRVFASVHNIQANVPPENVAAMWQAVAACDAYPAAAGAAAGAGSAS